ncbi:MAG: glycosyltransferase family 39 protein, partial [Candidatus Omnitrophota bacterium]
YVKLAFDRKTALFSTLIACVYSEHVIYSVLSTGETMFHFFLFSSFLFFMKFIKEAPKGPYLVFSGFLLGCASLCRFEGGLFIPLLTLFLFMEKKRYISLFFFTAMILPGWWMFISYRVMHDPLFFLHVSDAVVPSTFNLIRDMDGLRLNLFDRISGWPKMLWDTLTPPAVILGFLGLGYSLWKKKHVYSALLFLILFFVFIYKSAQEELFFDYRYGITLGLLFIPFSIFMIYKLLHIIGQRWRRVILALFIAYFAYRMVPAAIQQRPVTPSFVKDIGCYLSTHLNPQDKILVDSPYHDDFMEAILMYSKVYEFRRAFCIPRKIVDQHHLVDEKGVMDILNKEQPRFIVYAPEGYLPDVLLFSSLGKREKKHGIIFDFLYESGPYRIYEAIYRKGS